MDSAQKGLIITLSKVKPANESHIEKTIHHSSIYRLLESHG